MNKKIIERQSLLVSVFVNFIIGIAGLLVYIVTNLNALLLDGVFSLIAFVSSLAALFISKNSHRTTESFPNGMYFLEPLYGILKSILRPCRRPAFPGRCSAAAAGSVRRAVLLPGRRAGGPGGWHPVGDPTPVVLVLLLGRRGAGRAGDSGGDPLLLAPGVGRLRHRGVPRPVGGHGGEQGGVRRAGDLHRGGAGVGAGLRTHARHPPVPPRRAEPAGRDALGRDHRRACLRGTRRHHRAAGVVARTRRRTPGTSPLRGHDCGPAPQPDPGGLVRRPLAGCG